MSIINGFKNFFKFDINACRKRFALAEIDDLTRQIKEEYNYIRELERKRDKAKCLAFMELKGV